MAEEFWCGTATLCDFAEVSSLRAIRSPSIGNTLFAVAGQIELT